MTKDIGKLLGILASIAGIIAACIAVIALIPAFGQWLSPRESKPNTQSFSPTASESISTAIQPTQSQPTSTYTPYAPPISPTLTIEPTIIPTIDTRPTDTPPGTVLQIGERWTKQGFSVQLRSLTFAFGDEADLEFVLTNNTGHTLFFHFSNDTNVVMKDDLGRIYNWATPYEYDMILENGSYDNLRLYKGGNFSGIQYLIITVDLPSLIYAQWKN